MDEWRLVKALFGQVGQQPADLQRHQFDHKCPLHRMPSAFPFMLHFVLDFIPSWQNCIEAFQHNRIV